MDEIISSDKSYEDANNNVSHKDTFNHNVKKRAHYDYDEGKEDYSYQRASQDMGKDRDFKRNNRYKKYDKIATKKLDIDYKKPDILKEFLTEKGKILSRLITGNSTQNQHKLTREVKRARYIGLLPSA